jgi:predicted cupin superfamily sugar epimerase
VNLSEADRLIAQLALKPHPEGGHFRETFRDHSPPRVLQHAGGGDTRSWPSGQRSGEGDKIGRAHSTAILFLLKAGEISRWHRIDAVEVWHYYRGAPLELMIEKTRHVLGAAIENGQEPQLVVPAGAWQRAQSLGGYTLVGCTVAPGFEFSKFELAPDGFEP